MTAAELLPSPLLGSRVWIRDSLPAILTDLRHAEGASISEVARGAGVSYSTVRRWETGESVPTAAVLARLELHYRVDRGRLTVLAARTGGRRRDVQAAKLLSAGPSTSIHNEPTTVGMDGEAVSDRHPEGRSWTYRARLSCGVVLTYGSPTFVPDVKEMVPCRRHGTCPVVYRGRLDARKLGGSGRRVQSRTQRELLDFLSRQPVTSVHTLRRNRFTLRTVAAAQKDGLVEVDFVTGRIALGSAAVGPVHQASVNSPVPLARNSTRE
jgi:transcriptional regulator with XRE-family HTH domain